MPAVPAELVEPFRAFVRRVAPGGRVAVLCHSDADGVAAGAILARALARVRYAAPVDVTRKGEGAWHPDVAGRLAALRPHALVVADLGCRAEPVLPGVPTLFLDHHRPDGVPPGAVLVTGYGTDPTPTAGLLAFAGAGLLTDVADLDWLAAVSLLSDLGDSAPFDLLAAAKKRHTAARLKELTALVNAPRRSAAGDARPALDLLLTAADPKAALLSPKAEPLRAAKAETAAAFNQAKQAGPKFSGPVALVRVDSPCQVHPLVAQIWRTRLPGYVVIAANVGYLPGRVNFSARTLTGANLLDFLKEHAPAGAGAEYGHGHDQATGGSLPFAAWNEFVTRLGFGPEAKVGTGERAGVQP